jgi:hypothetical protein
VNQVGLGIEHATESINVVASDQVEGNAKRSAWPVLVLVDGSLSVELQVSPRREAVLTRDDQSRITQAKFVALEISKARYVATHSTCRVFMTGGNAVHKLVRSIVIGLEWRAANAADRWFRQSCLEPTLELRPIAIAVFECDYVLGVRQAEAVARTDALPGISIIGMVRA